MQRSGTHRSVRTSRELTIAELGLLRARAQTVWRDCIGFETTGVQPADEKRRFNLN